MLPSMSDTVHVFAKNLSELRKLRNLTQEGLAEICDVTHQSVWRWENAQSLPTPGILKALAKALKVPETRLFFDPSIIDPELAMQVIQANLKKK